MAAEVSEIIKLGLRAVVYQTGGVLGRGKEQGIRVARGFVGATRQARDGIMWGDVGGRIEANAGIGGLPGRVGMGIRIR